MRALVAQRVYALALGYEDLNDHDELRRDSLLALLVGRSDLTGRGRWRARDLGCPLAGSSTLNRLELGTAEGAATDRYKRIAADPEAMDRLLVEVFLESYARPPREIVLDLDATDDPLHGRQEGRFFHGYYRHYCYLLGSNIEEVNPDNLAGAAAARWLRLSPEERERAGLMAPSHKLRGGDQRHRPRASHPGRPRRRQGGRDRVERTPVPAQEMPKEREGPDLEL